MTDLVIVGGGFAGMWAALTAAREIDAAAGDVKVKMVSRDGYLTIRPRLYEANPATLRTPLHPVLEPAGVGFVEGTVSSIDVERRQVATGGANGPAQVLGYDRLVLAAGSELRQLPVPGAAEHAWNIDTYDAAVALDGHLKLALGATGRPGHDTVVIIGAGFTGIELATEMRARIEAHAGPEAAAQARVVLVEQAAAVGPELGDAPRPPIEDALRAAKVELKLGAGIERIDNTGVSLTGGERIEAATAIVTAGLRASSLAALLPVGRDELGRLPADDRLKVEGVPHVYAAGDIARAYVDDDHLALMSCQHAMMMGKVAGYNAARDMLGLPLRPYRQPDYVTCLDLGASGALFTSGWDRRVQKIGDEAKQRKRMINTQWIYPPKGGRDEILAAAEIGRRPGR